MSASSFLTPSKPSRRIAPAPRRNRKREDPGKKRSPVAAACQQCQRRKCKCDGNRPVCQACASRDLECEYEVSEGTSQKNRFKQKFDALEFKLNDLEALTSELTHSNEELALHLLVRLRAGEPIRDIVQSVSDTGFSRAASTLSDGQSQQSPFPPLQQDPLFHDLGSAPFMSDSLVDPLVDPTLLRGSGSSEAQMETDDSHEVMSLISQASSTRADDALGTYLLSNSGLARNWTMLTHSDDRSPGEASRVEFPFDWNSGSFGYGGTSTLACAG